MTCATSPVDSNISVQTALDYLQENMGFQCGSLLGKGTYGTVVRVFNRNDVPLAAKIVKKSMLNELEVYIWPQLQHENVLKLLDVIQKVDGVVIFLTDLMATNMFLHLQDCDFKKDPNALERCRSYARQVINGISYLHRLSLCHLDLRAENVFLTEEDDRAVVADFSGLAYAEAEKSFCPLPRALRPPELLLGGRKGIFPQSIDLWSCGLFLANLFLGKGFYLSTIKNTKAGQIDAVHAYTSYFQCEIFVAECVGNTYTSCSFSKSCMKNFIGIVRRFLQMNPRNRLKAEEALSHPFLLLNSSIQKRQVINILPNGKTDVVQVEENSIIDVKGISVSEDLGSTFYPESVEKIESEFDNNKTAIQGKKLTGWSKYKTKFLKMKFPFSVPFLKSLHHKKSGKNKINKSFQVEENSN